MNVLSLFDGMSCGQIALNRAGIKYDNYFASEIDKHAINVTQYNYPGTIQLGDVRNIQAESLPKIDILIGGSPCQSISNLVSAQNRARYYWTNIKFELPSDKEIFLKDILDANPKDSCILTPGRFKWLTSEKGLDCVKKRYAAIDPIKANCLTARSDASWNCNYVSRDGYGLTKLTCEEYEKLQTVPVGYTSYVRDSERYKMLGNAWTVDVIVHIMKHMKFD